MGERRGIYNTPKQKARRKELRNSSTAAEAVLWKRLQRRQILGKKFRRQYSLGPYIVDFYCPECQIVIELDGAYHFSFLANDYETRRAKYLQELGLQVIRLENQTVYRNIESVLETIREGIRLTTPSAPFGADTPPLGGGE